MEANEAPMLSLGEVNERLGVTMAASFLTGTLGIVPAAKKRRAILFTEPQFVEICASLAAHAAGLGKRSRGHIEDEAHEEIAGGALGG